MKLHRNFQIIAIFIILTGLLALIPAELTRAEADLQTIPTRGPTRTSTATLIPIATYTPLPGAPKSTPQPGTTSAAPTATLGPTSALATAGATVTGTLPAVVTDTPPVVSTTAAGELTATSVAATATVTIGDTPTAGAVILPTQPNGAGTPPQNQTTMDFTGILVTLGAIAVELVIVFWGRPKQK